jgi:RimJ/RimL family protein N-acetyltransferase
LTKYFPFLIDMIPVDSRIQLTRLFEVDQELENDLKMFPDGLHRFFTEAEAGDFFYPYPVLSELMDDKDVYAIRSHQASVGFVTIEEFTAGILEIGYHLLPSARGLGIAFRAVSAFVKTIERAYPDCDLNAWIAPDNRSSLTLAEKLGFSFLREDEWIGENYMVLEKR